MKVTAKIYLDKTMMAKSESNDDLAIKDIMHRYSMLYEDFITGAEPADKLTIKIEVKK